MPSRKISLILSSLRGDGAVAMMLTLAKGFVAHGHQVDLLAVRLEGERVDSVPEEVRLVNLAARRTVLAVPALVRYLRDARPDVVVASEHYSGLPALYALRLARTGARCVIRQDNTWGMDSRRFQGRHKLLTPFMVKQLFRRAEIIAVSEGVARDFVAHFPRLANNIQVIYNPIITDALQARSKAAIDHPWFKPGQPPVVVAVGRLAAAKGFDLLIDAFSRVAASSPARLLILGEGPERPALETRIREHDLCDRCQLAGYQPNPLAFIAKARVFVLSSRFEGLPTVLIEALATGAPAIATDCPSGPREILADGKYGTLVPPEDIDALTAAITNTLEHPPTRAGDLDAWLQQFAIDTSIKRHLALFEACLAAPPPHLRRAPLPIADREESR